MAKYGTEQDSDNVTAGIHKTHPCVCVRLENRKCATHTRLSLLHIHAHTDTLQLSVCVCWRWCTGEPKEDQKL